MRDTLLPLTDLGLLQREILRRPPDAALPANLPDGWLKLLARDLDALLSDDGRDPLEVARFMVAPLALIYRLLEGKSGAGESSIPIAVLQEYLIELWVEVSSELVSRLTQTQFEPATLQSIFSNRELTLRRGAPDQEREPA